MIVAVCGMEREARIAAGGDVVTVVGGSSGRLRERLESVLAGARGVISIGIAGALSPQLRPGDFVVAAAILAPGKRFAVDSVKHPLKALGVAMRGVRTDGPMAKDIPLDKQRPAEFVFSRHVERRLEAIRTQKAVSEERAAAD